MKDLRQLSYGSKLPLKKFSLHFLLVLMIVFDVLCSKRRASTNDNCYRYPAICSCSICWPCSSIWLKQNEAILQLPADGCTSFARVSYGLFLLPVRAVEFSEFKEGANKVAAETVGSELCLYKNTWLQDGSSFYITKGRHQILKKCSENGKKEFILVDEQYLDEVRQQKKVMKISTRYKSSPVSLIRVNGSSGVM